MLDYLPYRSPAISTRGIWGTRFHHSVVVFTADQDWAPEWACEVTRYLMSKIGFPLHVFRTNPSPALDLGVREGTLSQGWHPNFMEGSSHGTTPEGVIATCNSLFPNAKTARTHSYFESSLHTRLLAEAGIVADSQGLTACQPGLEPLLHWTGIIRLPLFFEDDVFFELSSNHLSTAPVIAALRQPGLKVLDFHPLHIAANTPSALWYKQYRQELYEPDGEQASHVGRGTQEVLFELVNACNINCIEVIDFGSLIADLLAMIEDWPIPTLASTLNRGIAKS